MVDFTLGPLVHSTLGFERVFNDDLGEATSNEDIGVKYIADFHGLIEETFKSKFKMIE